MLNRSPLIFAATLAAGICLAPPPDARAQGQLVKSVSELVQLLRSGGRVTTLIARNDAELARILSELQGAVPPTGLDHAVTGTAPRLTEPLPPEIERLIEEAILSSSLPPPPYGPFGAEAFAPLEREINTLAPTASLARRADRLEVLVSEPEDFLKLLEASRRDPASEPSVLAGCELTACFGNADVSLSGSCGALGLSVSSAGSAALGIDAERASLSVQLSREGIEVGTEYRPIPLSD